MGYVGGRAATSFIDRSLTGDGAAVTSGASLVVRDPSSLNVASALNANSREGKVETSCPVGIAGRGGGNGDCVGENA